VLVAAGVPVTINSDDPPMFATTLGAEYAVAARLLGLDERGLAGLALRAVDASFLDGPDKAALRAEIAEYTDRYVAGTLANGS
jgi:aminodeoxyfutalosine deaminase